MHRLLNIADELTKSLKELHFSEPVSHVYNPLAYAREAYQTYVTRFAAKSPRMLLLGMNPGPFGMAQTGIPFGDMPSVRDWIGIQAKVDKPAHEHPKRPVQGFNTPRREVSGQRLWGWAAARFGTPERFFEHFFVYNYCPLAFMDEGGRNVTPDKLPASEREPLLRLCDAALLEVAKYFPLTRAIGVGRFAEQRAKIALGSLSVPVSSIPHPSPASPQANRGWAEAVDKALMEQGVLK